MKEEYKKFKEAVSAFLDILEKKEDRLLNMDSEIENKRERLAALDKQLVEKQRLHEIQMDQLKNSLGTERDRAFRYTREAELKLAEAESARAMAGQELGKAQEERQQIRLKLKELEEKEREFAEKVSKFKEAI